MGLTGIASSQSVGPIEGGGSSDPGIRRRKAVWRWITGHDESERLPSARRVAYSDAKLEDAKSRVPGEEERERVAAKNVG